MTKISTKRICELLTAGSLKAEVLHLGDLSPYVSSIYAGDLLSDVLAHAQKDSLIITMQAHPNSIAVAQTKGAQIIILCNNADRFEIANPSSPNRVELIELAKEHGISLFLTTCDLFTVCGEMYSKLGFNPTSL